MWNISQVLVLDAGKVREFDSPGALLADRYICSPSSAPASASVPAPASAFAPASAPASAPAPASASDSAPALLANMLIPAPIPYY